MKLAISKVLKKGDLREMSPVSVVIEFTLHKPAVTFVVITCLNLLIQTVLALGRAD